MKLGITTKLTLAIAAATMLANTAAPMALAAKPQGDVFNRSTGPSAMVAPSTPAPSSLIHSYKSKAAPWFEAFDEQVGSHFATPKEQLLLTQPFGTKPQLEKVIEWTNTAAAVSKKYKELSRIIKAMPLTGAVSNDPAADDLLTYKNALADWYDQAGDWLQDYIKPRPPARTIEELNDQLKAMQNRSDQLKQSMAQLQKLDSDLRGHFNVVAPKYDNKILQFASRPAESSINKH